MRLFLLLLATISLAPPAYAYDRVKMLNSLFSVVMIRGYNPDGSLAYGSGVVVAPNSVVTNCHIFRKTEKPWISRGEDTYTIVSVQADRYHDMCLLKSEGLPFSPAKIGSASTMKKGQEVAAIGHSSGVPSPLTAVGTLKSIYPYANSNIIRASARFAMGASGSGLFDGDGNLIGINTFKSPGKVAYFYALPIEWLAEVEKLPVETKFPIDAKAFWEEEDLNKPYFMQMTLPEINQDWAKLNEVAQRWIKAEPNSTEAWYELGWSHENLANKVEAEKAYQQSLKLSASNTDALFRLGVLASQKGDNAEAQRINIVLTELDPEIAKEFNKAISETK